MTRDDAIAAARNIARGYATDHDYLPKNLKEALEWMPHEWVIDAMIAAYRAGLDTGKRAQWPFSSPAR